MNEREVKAEVWLPLSQGKVTVIDFDDFEKVRNFKWCARKSSSGNTFYACRAANTVQLHHEIMPPPTGMEIDHIDRDGLNNRRSNLRIVTHRQNILNRGPRRNKTSKFCGVSRHQKQQKWQAGLELFGKHIHLGSYEIEADAARAYDEAAIKYFGSFAQLNFP